MRKFAILNRQEMEKSPLSKQKTPSPYKKTLSTIQEGHLVKDSPPVIKLNSAIDLLPERENHKRRSTMVSFFDDQSRPAETLRPRDISSGGGILRNSNHRPLTARADSLKGIQSQTNIGSHFSRGVKKPFARTGMIQSPRDDLTSASSNNRPPNLTSPARIFSAPHQRRRETAVTASAERLIFNSASTLPQSPTDRVSQLQTNMSQSQISLFSLNMTKKAKN